MSPAPVYAGDPDCPPPCLEPNPDYDPDDSSSEPCLKLTGPIEGEPCKECKEGEMVEKPKDCWSFTKQGEHSDPQSCPDCEVVVLMPECPHKVEKRSYYRAVADCKGFKSYTSQWIVMEKHTVCGINWDWGAIAKAAYDVGACAFSCGQAAVSKDAADIADCLDCLDNFPGYTACDFVERCEETDQVFPIPMETHNPAGGPCP